MKNKILYLFVSLVLLLSMPSCLYEDLGNYDYKNINEVIVKGIETDKYITRMASIDNYDLVPEVEFTTNKSEDNYSYKWEALKKNATSSENAVFELGTEKNLTSRVDLAAGEYICYYYITDKTTNIVWSTKFYLAITSEIDEKGWLVLCDVDGVGRLDIVSPLVSGDFQLNGWRVNRNIVQNMDVMGKPRKLVVASDFHQDHSLLYVAGDNGTYRLKNKTYHMGDSTDMRLEFGSYPEKVILTGMAQTITNSKGDNMVRIAVDDKGDFKLMNYVQGGALYMFNQNINPTYTPDNGEERYFVAAPWCGVRLIFFPMGGMANTGENGNGGNNDNNNHNLIVYDQTYKRFLRIANTSNKPEVMSFVNDGALWNGAKTGLRMIYGENISVSGNQFRQMFLTLLTDEKDVWLYAVAPLKNGENKQMYFMKLSPGADLLGATSYAFSSQRERMYFSKGSSVYVIDYSAQGDGVAQPILDFPGEEVVKLCFWLRLTNVLPAQQPWNQSTDWLTIGSNRIGVDAGECGVLRSYELPSLMGGTHVEKVKESDLGKIVDIAFKEIMPTKFN